MSGNSQVGRASIKNQVEGLISDHGRDKVRQTVRRWIDLDGTMLFDSSCLMGIDISGGRELRPQSLHLSRRVELRGIIWRDGVDAEGAALALLYEVSMDG